MGSHKAFLGTLTIANGAAASNVLSNRQLSMARALIFDTSDESAFTGTVTVVASPRAGIAFASLKPLRVAGADVTLTANKIQEVVATGVESVAISSGSNEGEARTVRVYAVLEL